MSIRDTLQKRYAPFCKAGEVIGVKQVVAKMEAQPNGDIIAVANTAGIDLADEVVVPGGGDPSYFAKFKTLYWNHNYGLPIGTARSIKLRPDNSWYVRFALSKQAVTEYGQDVRALIDEGVVNGVSIGFAALQWGPPTDEETKLYGDARNIVRRWKWLELSITPMPCNPDATLRPTAPDEGKRIAWQAPSKVIRWQAEAV